MRGRLSFLAATLLLANPVGLSASAAGPVHSSCPSLLVVKARVQFLGSQPANEPVGTEWGLVNWRSDQTYRLTVAKVLIGTLPDDGIIASALAHGQIRDDISFRFLLEDRGSDGYRIVQSLGRDYRSEFAQICRAWAK